MVVFWSDLIYNRSYERDQTIGKAHFYHFDRCGCLTLSEAWLKSIQIMNSSSSAFLIYSKTIWSSKKHVYSASSIFTIVVWQSDNSLSIVFFILFRLMKKGNFSCGSVTRLQLSLFHESVEHGKYKKYRNKFGLFGFDKRKHTVFISLCLKH